MPALDTSETAKHLETRLGKFPKHKPAKARGMIEIALLLLALLFAGVFIRGLMSNRMPSKFGAAIRDKRPARFYLNGALIAFFAIISFACAFWAH